MQFSSLVLLPAAALFAGLASAAPVELASRAVAYAVPVIQTIMPGSKTCAAADAGAKYPNDCATAEQAAPHLIQAFMTYQIWTYGEMAAILALIALESGELKYRHNLYPGTPGQGTSAMFMPTFVGKYASSIPELASKVSSDVAATLELVVPDQYNFGAAPWYYTTYCSDAVKAQLKAGSDDGFAAYVTQCVQTTMTDARMAYWKTAKTAFGI